MKNIRLIFFSVSIFLFASCGNNNGTSGYVNSNNNAEKADTSRGSASNPVNNANPVPAINSDSGRSNSDTSSRGDGSISGSSNIKGESHYGTSQGNNVTGAPAINRSDTSYKK